ncbi:MAG: hypothetical protein WD042_19560 [Phycisphaeraceae bacterium]
MVTTTEVLLPVERKPDSALALARFEAWWHGRVLDRPPVTIYVKPAVDRRRVAKSHATLRDRWLDVDYQLDRFEAEYEASTYLAETFPIFFPNIGPEICATVFGCELEFSEHSSWAQPIASSCRQILDIEPNLDNQYWNTIRQLTQRSLARGKGRWITAITDLHTNGDLLASLLDPQELCVEMADDAASVRAACDYVTRSFGLMYDDLWAPIAATGSPCTSWTRTMHQGRYYPVSCDFLCMISPEMARDAIMPSIIEETRFLERSIFHLDGPNALKHLDALLAIPTLHAVQWLYGAGSEPASRWIDVYQRIQAGGKSLQLISENLEDAKAVAAHLTPGGVWFTPMGHYDRAEAQAFIDWTAKWASRTK